MESHFEGISLNRELQTQSFPTRCIRAIVESSSTAMATSTRVRSGHSSRNSDNRSPVLLESSSQPGPKYYSPGHSKDYTHTRKSMSSFTLDKQFAEFFQSFALIHQIRSSSSVPPTWRRDLHPGQYSFASKSAPARSPFRKLPKQARRQWRSSPAIFESSIVSELNPATDMARKRAISKVSAGGSKQQPQSKKPRIGRVTARADAEHTDKPIVLSPPQEEPHSNIITISPAEYSSAEGFATPLHQTNSLSQPNNMDHNPSRRSSRTRKRSARAIEAGASASVSKKARVLLSQPEQFQLLSPPESETNSERVRAKSDSSPETGASHTQESVNLDESTPTILSSTEAHSRRSSITTSSSSQNPSTSLNTNTKTLRERKASTCHNNPTQTMQTPSAKRCRLDVAKGSTLKSSEEPSPLSDNTIVVTASPVQEFKPEHNTAEGSHESATPKPVAQQNDRVQRTWTRSGKTRFATRGADIQTHSASPHVEPARRGGKTTGRGAAKSSRGGNGNGRGRGGKTRGKGRDDDSPEPPRRVQTQEDALTVRHIKARQAELRRFFNVVGTQQTEILDVLSARDLNRMVKKPKAHRQVPEFDEISDDIKTAQEEAVQLAAAKLEIAMEAENLRYEAEKLAIEQRCRAKIADLHEEYTKGAQGDLILFRRAFAAAHDETRTQDGSEIDYLPHYHEFPEPDARIRGLASEHITDEKPFKHNLLTYDDEARREVIDDDLVGPIIQAFAQKNADRRAEESRRKTQTMEALVEEADRQLKIMASHLSAQPQPNPENANSSALSYLADAASMMAERESNQQRAYPSVENGDMSRREFINRENFLGRNTAPSSPRVHQSSDNTTTLQKPVANKASQIQGTRRSLRNLQPNGPVSQIQTQPSTPSRAQAQTPTHPAAVSSATNTSSGHGQTIAPAPPKLAPTPSVPPMHTRPSPIDTRSAIMNPEGPPPMQPTPTQSQPSQSHGLQPLQPRHLSQQSLPPPPPPLPLPHPPPQYSPYGQQFSPVYPPHPYPPPSPHANRPQHHLPPPQPPHSPYHHQQPPPGSPYIHHQHQQQQQHPHPYHQYGHQLPPPPPPPPPSAAPPLSHQQQQYSFLPPQQGPTPSQLPQPISRPQSRSRSHTTGNSPIQLQDPFRPANINGYHHHQQQHHHNRSHSHSSSQPITFSTQPPPSILPPPPPPPPPPPQTPQNQSNQPVQPQPPPAQPVYQSQQYQGQQQQSYPLQPQNFAKTAPKASRPSKAKSRLRGGGAGGKGPNKQQPVTFVNQTQATRKAAAEQLAKEEAAAAAGRKERSKASAIANAGSGNGRKLAPKP